MKIEHATTDDIPELCVLLEILFSQEADFQSNRELHAKGLRQIIDQPECGQILVLREEDSIIGMANLLFTISTVLGGRVGILDDLVVHPMHRDCGAGSLLLQSTIDAAKTAGCLRLSLNTDRTNEAARRFYKRFGFIESQMVPLRLPLS